MFESLDNSPSVAVRDRELRRLLGYPPGRALESSVAELAHAARDAFWKTARPWTYVREVAVELHAGSLRLGGVDFPSRRLRELFADAGAARALVLAVSAGPGPDELARILWLEGKPDEAFFLESYGSAAVEALVNATNGRICAWAEEAGWYSVPHYSPGYSGWDMEDQPKLFELIVGGMTTTAPQPLSILDSGMLSPRKSLLGVVGLAPKSPGRTVASRGSSCRRCSLSPCAYRRGRYAESRRLATSVPLSNPATSNQATCRS